MERIGKIVLFFALLAAPLSAQWQIGQRSFYHASAAPATPVADHRWQVNYASNTCGSGVACTNGAGINTLVDQGTVGGKNLSQATTAKQPIYTTGAVNGLAAGAWASASTQYVEAATPIGGSSFSGFAVFKLTSTGVNQAIFGNNITGSAVEWRINSSNHQELLAQNVASICTGTATFTTGTWYAIAFTYNSSTGACNLYTISGGTATSDGSATSAQTVTNGIADIGVGAATDYFNSMIAEAALSTSVWSGSDLAANASYIHTTYGI